MYRTIPITPVSEPYRAGTPAASGAASHMELMHSVHAETAFHSQATHELDGQISDLPDGAQVFALRDGHGQTHGYFAVVREGE